MAQISADVFMVFPLLSAGRSTKYAAHNPKQLDLHLARGAVSLPEEAKIISRAAARLCESPRSPEEKTQAPAGPGNHGAHTGGRSCAPLRAGGRF